MPVFDALELGTLCDESRPHDDSHDMEELVRADAYNKLMTELEVAGRSRSQDCCAAS